MRLTTNKKVQKARIQDAPQMHALVNSFAERGEMLARPLSEIYENVRDYFVIRDGDRVLACVAFHVCWADLAEIKALAVAQEVQDQGLGAALVQSCLDEARDLGIPQVFALTYKPGFFERLGFARVDVNSLPRKVWGECIRCPKFPNCDEIALVKSIEV